MIPAIIDLRQLIIGKLYSADSLAYYNRGYMIPNVFVANVNTAIDSVLFPVLSGEQSNRDTVRSMTRRSIRISSYVMWPIMFGIAACARPIVLLLLTEKWLPSVPYVMLFCFSYALLPLQTANLNAIKALGYSDIYLRLEIIRKAIGFVILILTMWYGPLIMAASNLLIGVVNQLVNVWPNRKLLSYSYREQVMDIAPSALLAIGMFMVVWALQIVINNPIYLLLVQILTGACVYIGGSIIFRNESFIYIWKTIHEMRRKKKPEELK